MVYWLHKSTPLHNVAHFLKVSNLHSFCFLKLWQSELCISVHEPPYLVTLIPNIQKARISWYSGNALLPSTYLVSAWKSVTVLMTVLPFLQFYLLVFLQTPTDTSSKWGTPLENDFILFIVLKTVYLMDQLRHTSFSKNEKKKQITSDGTTGDCFTKNPKTVCVVINSVKFWWICF